MYWSEQSRSGRLILSGVKKRRANRSDVERKDGLISDGIVLYRSDSDKKKCILCETRCKRANTTIARSRRAWCRRRHEDHRISSNSNSYSPTYTTLGYSNLHCPRGFSFSEFCLFSWPAFSSGSLASGPFWGRKPSSLNRLNARAISRHVHSCVESRQRSVITLRSVGLS